MDISFKDPGDTIVAIGAINGELGGSEYLKQCHELVEGPIPGINLEVESSLHKICLELISKKIIKSAHDISDGGLSVNLAESICFGKDGIGADISINRKLRTDQILFGESQGVIIVTLDQKDLHHVALISQKYNVHTQTIGSVTDSAILKINDSIDIGRDDLKKAYFNAFHKIMSD
jgi:phosphoribosylformylglycinamidine synthase